MPRYKIVTLVDITRSNPSRSETNSLQKGQQANFNSLIQAIGIRSNLNWDTDPVMHTGALPQPLEGKATHWVWEFYTERDEVFTKGDDSVGLLLDDLNNVPVVPDLLNTVDIDPAAFQTRGSKLNIWVSESL
jgi:hypothetical protein